MKNPTKRSMMILSFALLFVLLPSTALASSDYSYSGTVYKYSDYQTSSQKKSDSSDYAYNESTRKPSGTFISWVEASKAGDNVTSKVSYTKNKTLTMKYQKMLDSPNTIAYNLYISGTNLRLNISTSLNNFKSGSVEGYWSPDN